MVASVRTIWSRTQAIATAVKSLLSEGTWRGPFTGFGELGGAFTLGSFEDGFSRNLIPSQQSVERFGPVFACVSIISQELARIPILHKRVEPDGRSVNVTNKAPARIFRSPNAYQTRTDMIVWLARSLLLDGNAYAVASRNDRYEIDKLYPIPPGNCWPYVVDGEIFYRVGSNDIAELADIESFDWFPQRDVFHLRMHCPRHPLIGESPITAALLPAASGMQINSHTAHFFSNMSRPSGILRHPKTLSAEAMERIKRKFMEITQRSHSGEPIVLQEEMDWKPLTMSAVDAELVESYKLSERQIAQVFRIPPFLLGDLEKATFQNVESLSRFFVSSSLGFYVSHLEDALTKFFALPNNEYIYLDVESALLRADLKERMDAYAKGIQSGVFSPNEARAKESLPPVEFGDDPRVQQQLVPLSYGVNLQPPSAAPAPAPEPEPEPTEEERAVSAEVARRAILKAMHA